MVAQMGSKQTTLLWGITEIVEKAKSETDDRICRVALSDIETRLINAGYIKKAAHRNEYSEGKKNEK